MFSKDTFISKPNAQGLVYSSDSRMGYQNLRPFEINRHTSSSHSLVKFNDCSRSLNNKMVFDKASRLQSSQLNQRSNYFMNQKMPEKLQSPGCYWKNPSNEQNLNLHKSQMNRAQSMNAIHSSQRLQMLTKINTLLQNHSTHPPIHNENPEKINEHKSQEFRREFNTKIDRLESYLHKIKNQRTKEKNPTNKIEPEILKFNPRPQDPLPVEKGKLNSQTVFKELDKLKQQIGRVRVQALEVQKKNSVSREKSLNVVEVESNLNKIKQQMAKLNQLNQKIHRLSPSPINKQSQPRVFSGHNLVKAQQVSNLNTTNYINSLQPYNSNSNLSSSFALNQNKGADFKGSKPKITFSFAPQK